MTAGLSMRVVAGALAIAMSGGCSFVFVQSPPKNHEGLAHFNCTNSSVAPILDATLGGVAFLGLVGDAADNGLADGAAEGLVLVGGIAASAVYGFVKVRQCKAAETRLAARLQQESSGADELDDGEQEALDGTDIIAPVPAPPAPPFDHTTTRAVVGLTIGLLSLFNTAATETAVAPFFTLRTGVTSQRTRVEFIFDYGRSDHSATRGVGVSVLAPLTLTAPPASGTSVMVGGVIKYMDVAWAGPKASGFALIPTIALRLNTLTKAVGLLEFGYEFQTFEQAPSRLLSPSAFPGGFAHGPRLGVGVGF